MRDIEYFTNVDEISLVKQDSAIKLFSSNSSYVLKVSQVFTSDKDIQVFSAWNF